MEPDWTQHLPAACWERPCTEIQGQLVTLQSLSGSDFWDSGCVFERLFSQQQIVPSLILLFGSGDSTWHKETHFLITFHSFLSITLFNSLHVVRWLQVLWLYTVSLDAHILCSLFTIVTLERFFFVILVSFTDSSFVMVSIDIFFSPLKHPIGLSKPFDFQLFHCDFLMVPFSTCLAVSDLADTSIRIVSFTHLLLSFQSLRPQFHCGVFILLCFPYRRHCRRWFVLLSHMAGSDMTGLESSFGPYLWDFPKISVL